MTTFTAHTDSYFRAVRQGKPQVAMKAMRDAILTGTSDQVAKFVHEARIRAGVQDLTMLPDETWTVIQSGSGSHVVNVVSTDKLRDELLTGAANVVIDWPSGRFHWGTLVSFEVRGDRFTARTSDWALTETYLSA